MNNCVLEALLTRRSCRKYLKKQIDEKDLDAILTAGVYAPSGRNRQAAMLVSIQDEQTIEKISKMNAAVLGSDGDPFFGAPTVIVVFADPEVHTYLEDGSLAMGNLMLAAHSLGLASCWIHRARQVFSSEEGMELKKSWGVPEHYVGIGNCIIGYPDAEGFRPASERKAGNIIKIK